MLSCLQIGRILEIKRPIKKSQGAESIKVNVAWFYRPEESLGGRKVTVLFALGAYCASRRLHLYTLVTITVDHARGVDPAA